MIWRIRDRATFEALRREGRRARRGDVSVAYLPDGPDGGSRPRVAYGVGRKVGTAVVRNRVRRRLRAAAHEAARAGRLPAGAYLVTVRPGAASLTYDDLRGRLGEAVAAVAASGREAPR